MHRVDKLSRLRHAREIYLYACLQWTNPLSPVHTTAAAAAAARHPNLISGVHHRSRRWLEKSRHVAQHACGFVPAMNPLKSGSSWDLRWGSYFLFILWISFSRERREKFQSLAYYRDREVNGICSRRRTKKHAIASWAWNCVAPLR